MEPQRRLEVARKIVSAAGDHGIPPEDVIIDPLAMPVGAEPRAVTLFLETLQLLRDELGVNMTCGASNTSFGLPGPRTRSAPRSSRSPQSHGLTSAIMDARSRRDRRGRARDRLPARPRRVGRGLDRRATAKQAQPHGRARPTRRMSVPELVASRRAAPGPGPARLRAGGRRDEGGARSRRDDALRLRELERRRDRLDLRRPRHVQEVQGARRLRHGAALAGRPARVLARRAARPAGGSPAARRREEDVSVVEVPLLQTRPKAALAGVGRHVILRPAVQKRYLELAEPTLEDQASDLERVLARDGRRRAARAARAAARARRDASPSDWKVTAVLCRRPADRRRARRHLGAALRDRLRPRDDDRRREPARPRDRPAGGRALDAQRAAAVRRRRDHADLRDDDGPGRARRLRALAHETLAELTAEVCEEAGVDPAEVYEIVVAGNVTMLQLALGIDPEPLSMAPFTIAARTLPEATAADFGVRVHARAPAVIFPALGAYVGPDIVAGILATGLTLDQRVRLFIDVGTNSEIVLGSSAERARDGGAGRPGVRGGADPLRHAGRRRRDRGREDRRRRGRADRDRRRRAGRPLRLGPRRRGRRARRRGHPRPLGALRRAARRSGSARSARRTSSTSPTTSFSRSATCASCSSRRRRSRPAGRSSAATSGIDPRTSRRCCSPARSAPTSRRRARSRSGSCRSCRCSRIVSAGNVAGEGAKIAALSVTERAAASAVLDEVRLRRALGPHRLQRPLHRPARVSRHDARVVVSLRRARAARQPDRERRGWDLEVRPLPPELHNRPERIRAAVDAAHGRRVVVAYARLRHARRARRTCRACRAPHCYELLRAGSSTRPGTYYLTDFLVRCFDRVVVRGLGLDRHPELRDDYFRHYDAGRLARAESDRRAARGGRARRRAARPAARGARDRRRAGARALPSNRLLELRRPTC